MKKTLVAWSSGKDSAWTLHYLSNRKDIEVVGLLTTFNEAYGRVAMHAVRRELVDAQAEAAALPLRAVQLPWPCSNADYERIMDEACRAAADQGIQAIAFGDLFLTDIRAYRERQLLGTGIEPIFPLWEIPTDRLAREMIAGGLKARLTCIDPVLPREFAGREFDLKLLEDLPESVDPCGENGEFHTFVYDGPMFRSPIAIESGEVVDRDGFTFADLVPVGQAFSPAD
jgi:uncharacterized protein (TIGR00290 family)